MTNIHDRYPDILGEWQDPELEHLVAQLDAVAQRFTSTPMPAAQSTRIANAVREHALASRKPQSRAWPYRVRLSRRVALLPAAALGIIAVLTGATLVFGIPAFPWNYGILQQTGQVPQGQEVALARSACGYTLTVSRVYADANVFLVAYSVTAPDGRTVGAGLHAPVVTDASGVTLLVSDYSGSATPGGPQYQAFDTGNIPGQPDTLKLHMVVPAIDLLHEQPMPSACTVPAAAGQPGAAPTPSLGTSSDDTAAVRGPFVFDFTVADHGGRESRPHLAVTRYGHTITLERVVSTPLETRFYVSGSAMNAYATLNAGGHTLNAGSWGPEDSLIVYRFEGSLYTDHGTWTFTIHARNPSGGSQVRQPLPPGTWTFTFTLP